MTEFPRVLFIAPQAFNHLTGSGVTFSNLFSGWPKDRLATVHNDVVPTSNDVCDRYFFLGRNEIDLFAPLRIGRAIRDRRSKPLATGGAGIAVSESRGLVELIQGDSAPQRVRLTAALDRWIADFKPEVLYTVLGSNAFIKLSALIRRRFSLPTVVHMMDDWPSINYQRGVLAPFERARMHRLLGETFSTATLTMGIGTAMCDAFARRYGRIFVPFQNCVDLERWGSVVRTDGASRGPPYRLMYFGSVFANAQLGALADVCRSVARLNASGFPLQFDIVSATSLVAPHRDVLAIDPAIRLIEPTLDDREFFLALAVADALVLPVNFDPASVSFIRYSMPTKVPAYMASGTPILVYGPRGVAQVDYATQEGWGLVVGDREPAGLDAALRRILVDRDLRERLRVRAQAMVTANHDTARVRAEFQNALKAVARAAA